MKKHCGYSTAWMAWMVVIVCITSSAQAEWIIERKGQKSFIENRGQFDNRLYFPHRKIEFAVEDAPGTIFFAKDGITYRLDEISKPQKSPKEMAREKVREAKEMAAGKKTHDEIERDENAFRFKTEFVHMVWEGANQDVEIVPSDKESYYHNYAMYTSDKSHIYSINQVSCYKKITYKNLYDNIDVVYEFHPVDGIKYSVIVHPGGDISKLKMRYLNNKKLSVDKEGKLHIKTKLGDIVEHAPISFYASNTDKIISSSFSVSHQVVSINIDYYDHSRTLIVDPWIQTPTYNTGWRCSWECERDGSGNVYVIGGVMPMQLLKYNAAGVLQWTYNTPYDTSNAWLGTFAVDNAGNSYVTAGSTAKIQKVNTNGTLVWDNANPGGIFTSTEFWNITFNCDQTRLIIGGTGGTLPPIPYIYQIDMNTGNVTNSLQVTGGQLMPTQEVRAIAPAGNGKYYFLTHDSFGYINQNFTLCGRTNNAKDYIPSGYQLNYKCENFRVDNTGICALKTYNGFAYVHRGNRIDKRSLATLATVATANIPGGGFSSTLGRNQVENSGIDIDDCGNIYVGSKNQVIKFDANLNQLQTYPTGANYNVYDIAVRGAGNEIIVCGSTGTSSSGARTGYIETIPTGACNVIPIVCCDASMCRVPPQCVSSPAVTIQVSTPGGTFSGPGVNPTTGVFNPAVAGVGTHKIVYTLACGADSIFIVVNACTPLSVCRETNGNLTVSGGNPTYSWSYWRQAQSTPITNQAQCTACGGSWIPFINICLVNSFPVTSCNTPAGWVQFATGTTVQPPPGTDTIQVTDNAGTAFFINGISTVPPCQQCPTITVTVQSKQDVTCANPTSGSATFTATGTTGAVTYTWSPATGSSSATATGLAAGTYNVTVRDANNCTGTGSVTINTPPSPSLTLTNPVNPSCGQNNGSVNATLSGGTAPYQVTIDNGQGNPITQNVPFAGTAPITGLPAGTYTVTVRDVNQCSTVSTFTLTAPNAPGINAINVTNEVCSGQNNGAITSVSSTGGSPPLQWSYAPAANPSNTTAINNFPVNNLAPGNYILYVRDANNCTASRTFTIAAGPNCCQLSLAISTTQPTCGQADGSITVTPSPVGNYTYAWNNNLPPQAAQSNLPSGTYRVTVSETANPSCNKDTVIILNPSNGPSIVFSDIVNPGCGQSNGGFIINLTGGTFPYQAVVDNGLGNTITRTIGAGGVESVYGLSAGTYQVTITDANGCTSFGNIVLTSPNPPVITSINATAETCAGDNNGTANVVVSGGTGNITYQWSNGATTASVSNLAPNTYTVTVTDAANCTATGSVTVSDGPNCCTWNISAAIVQPACGVSNGSISLTVLPASNYTYTWSNNVTTANNNNIGAGLYRVTITNTVNGCVKDTFFSLSNANAPTVTNIATTAASCNGNDGDISLTVTGGTGNITITWSNGATGNTITGLAAGDYNYTVTDQAGCQTTGSVRVAATTNCCPLQASATALPTSCGQNNGAINITITTPGSPPYRYSLTGNTYQQNNTFSGLSGGSYTVYVLDAANCGDTISVNVATSVNDLVVTFNTVEPGCAGLNNGSIEAIVSGGSPAYRFAWSNFDTLNPLTNIGAGNYSVTVTDANGCSLVRSVTLNPAQTFNISLGNDTSFCSGGSAVLLGPGGFTRYLWSTGDTTPAVTVSNTAVYSLTVTNASGCTATASVGVTVNPQPIVSLPNDTTVFENNPIKLVPVISGNLNGKYLWQPEESISCINCAQPVVNPSDTIVYILTYTDVNNCSDSASIRINVIKGGEIYMPNVFSPNGDGNNDVLKPLGYHIKNISWKVFNRWGELVFVSDDFNFGWDGYYKGMAQPVGVYVYTMEVTFMNKTVKHYKGSVTLIR
jgi:gliding motility-associated-like protein